MSRLPLALALILLAPVLLLADLTFPASYEVAEVSPGSFELTLTIPLIKGRYMKVRPIAPEAFQSQEAPRAQAGSGSLTRVWSVQADAADLPGSVFGLEGLLGTFSDVRFVLSTLDGRRYETVLRSTRSVFVVPSPPTGLDLAAGASLEGLRRVLQLPAFWLLLLFVGLAGGGWRLTTGAVVVCVAGGVLGHLTTGPVKPPALLLAVAGLPVAAALAVAGSSQRPASRWVALLLAGGVGFLSGWAGLLMLPREGLSSAELRLSTGLLLAGWAVGGAGIVAVLGLMRSLLPARARRVVARLLPICALAWLLYYGAGLVLAYGAVWSAEVQRLARGVVRYWGLPFVTDWTLGRLRLPLVTLALLVGALVAWPRRRRFQQRPQRALRVHWILLAVALLMIPVGNWRVANPFHTPRAPTPREATPVIRSLLNNTYRAFNLADEGAAFDRLAESLADELVADVYLDSRRRLTEGTRQGAKVTVKDVELLSVAAQPGATAGAFTFLCRWAVTARVKHWQHEHDRRNLYIGELTLVVGQDNWRISRLTLSGEEREVLPDTTTATVPAGEATERNDQIL